MEVNFNLRSKELNPSPINIVIRYNGKRLVYPSNIKVDPAKWSINKQRLKAKGCYENIQLSQFETGIIEVYNGLLTSNDSKEPTTQALKETLDIHFDRVNSNPADKVVDFLSWKSGIQIKNGKEVTVYSYGGFLATYQKETADKQNNKTGYTFSKNTVRNYHTAMTAVREFAEAKFETRKISFDDINLDFYNDFTSYYRNERKLSPNTIGTYIKIIKAVLREADERGMKVNPAYKSKKFVTAAKETDAIYLTETELQEMANLDLSTDSRLERVRDLFLVGCRTGLRWSDFSNLTSEDFETGAIRKRTQKQKGYVLIPIHPDVKLIMEKYDTENRLPQPISNQKFNKYIKEVCRLVPSLQKSVSHMEHKGSSELHTKVKKCELVSTHTARRSFATNCYLKGVPTRVIMSITGHKKEEMFFKYIRMTPSDDSKILAMFLTGTQSELKIV